MVAQRTLIVLMVVLMFVLMMAPQLLDTQPLAILRNVHDIAPWFRNIRTQAIPYNTSILKLKTENRYPFIIVDTREVTSKSGRIVMI